MKTLNYEQFRIIESNRKIQNGLVRRLKDSIKKIGYIDARPILVNEKMEIIDGQNRFVACKELGMPIVYAINKSNIENDIIISELNKNQLIWRLSDYVYHFMKRGVKYHSAIYEFEERYKFGISNSIIICSNSTTSNAHVIREGKNKELNPKREECAEFILSCKQLPFYKSRCFVQAVVLLFKKANEKQIEKLKKKYLSIPLQASSRAYMNVFQNIINKNLLEKDKIIL